MRNFSVSVNNMISCIWWNNGTVKGGNVSTYLGDHSIDLAVNIIQTPIPIDGTSSGKYARLIVTSDQTWSASYKHEGFIVCKV